MHVKVSVYIYEILYNSIIKSIIKTSIMKSVHSVLLILQRLYSGLQQNIQLVKIYEFKFENVQNDVA